MGNGSVEAVLAAAGPAASALTVKPPPAALASLAGPCPRRRECRVALALLTTTIPLPTTTLTTTTIDSTSLVVGVAPRASSSVPATNAL